jgi:hypothetical protein
MVLAALSFAAFAQSTSGELTGTVFDPANAVVPNASVTATNESTGIATTVTTTSAGQYRLSNLLVGKYDVTVAANGFTKSELKGVDGGFISDVAPSGTAIPGTNNSPTTTLVHNFLIPTSNIFADPSQAFSSSPRQMSLSIKVIF